MSEIDLFLIFLYSNEKQIIFKNLQKNILEMSVIVLVPGRK